MTAEKLNVCFLGPAGTYSHAAALNRFGDAVNYVPCSSISEILTSQPPQSSIYVLPYENSLNGPVLATLNILTSSMFSTATSHQTQHTSDNNRNLKGKGRGTPLVVREEVRLGVGHCLVVRRDKKWEGRTKEERLKGITMVGSHEQALAQCTQYLTTHLPHARRIPKDSTAGAALSLLDEDSIEGGDGEGEGAAICSAVVAQLNSDKLEILVEGIEDVKGNTTKFLIITSSHITLLPSHAPSTSAYTNYLFRTSLPYSTLFSIIPSSSNVSISSIDSRPTSEPGFGRILLVTVRVKKGCEEEEEVKELDGLEGDLLGSWDVVD